MTISRKTARQLLARIDAKTLSQDEAEVLNVLLELFADNGQHTEDTISIEDTTEQMASVIWGSQDVFDLLMGRSEINDLPQSELQKIAEDIAQKVDWESICENGIRIGSEQLEEDIDDYIQMHKRTFTALRVIECAKTLGWSCMTDDSLVTFCREHPAFSAPFSFTVAKCQMPESVLNFADDFDVQRYVKKHAADAATPQSVMKCLEMASAIKQELSHLAQNIKFIL